MWNDEEKKIDSVDYESLRFSGVIVNLIFKAKNTQKVTYIMEVSFRPQTINYSPEFLSYLTGGAKFLFALSKKRETRTCLLTRFCGKRKFFPLHCSSSNSRSEFNYQTIKYLQRRLSTSESVNHTSVRYIPL